MWTLTDFMFQGVVMLVWDELSQIITAKHPLGNSRMARCSGLGCHVVDFNAVSRMSFQNPIHVQ